MRNRMHSLVPILPVLLLLALTLSLLFAAAACSGPDLVDRGDPDVARLVEAGREAFDDAATDQALIYFGRALQRARAIDDPAAIGRAAYDLAACFLFVGDGEGALRLLAEAKAELARAGLPQREALLLEAKAARHAGRGGEAARLCEQVLALPDLSDDLAAQARLVEAHLACDAGDASAARAALDRFAARDRAAADDGDSGDGGSGDAVNGEGGGGSRQALFHRVAGRVALLERDPAAAAAAFDRAAEAFRSLGRFGEMARALADAGSAHFDAGEAALAGDRFYRAARSYHGQGEREKARALAVAAVESADRASDDALKSRAAALLNEIGGDEP